MSDSPIRRVRDCFDELRELSPDGREERLAALRGSDPELAAEVESLLHHAERPAEALERAPRIDSEELLESVLAEVGPGGVPLRVGRFRVLERLAHGGMGVVYAAEQDQPRRPVALKMLRHEFVSPPLLKRFRLEAEILGRLLHPGIAQIYDAGTVDLGGGLQPYFAMELIEGDTITEHARKRGLGTRDRLRLIQRVCEAIQVAHQKGVIHRDLKPDNILVVDEGPDTPGQPKILDFGVARATDSDVQVTTIQTDAGQLVGTLPYMSPEQVRGDTGLLDTRSDVYALGVLLFELLANRLPVEIGGMSIPDAALAISEREPTSLGSVDTQYRGDLDTIAAKALEKEPGRRYGSAAELGEDLRRYLESEPIRARPPSTWYQLSRFSRRNRVLVGSVVTIFTLTLVALVLLIGLTLRATRAEGDAQLRYEESEAIAGFYDDVLQTVRNLDRGPEVTVLDVLDEMQGRIQGELTGHPLVQARVLFTLGSVYRDLGRYVDSERCYQRCYDVRMEHLGPDSRETRAVAIELGMSLKQAGQTERALELLRGALPSLEEEHGPNAYITVATLGEIANVLDDTAEGAEEALAVYDEAIGRLEAEEGFGHSLGVTLLSNSGLLLRRLGEYEQSEARYRRALETARAIPDFAMVRTMGVAAQLGSLYVDLGRQAEAEPLLREAYAWTREHMGPNFIGTSMNGDMLAVLCIEQGRYEEADEILTAGIAALDELLGPEHRYALRLREHQIRLRVAEGRSTEARTLLDAALELALAEHGEDGTWTRRFRDLEAELLAGNETGSNEN